MKKTLRMLLAVLFAVCMLMLSAYASDVVMTVNGAEYTDHGTGWSAAVKLASNDTETTVKLFADWEADSGTGFVCPDGSSKNGALYVGEGIFTLDLNGYTLDRNAPEDKYSSSVLYVEDCVFTISDTSEAKTGTITGGYAQYGGGIYAEDCTLYINGGNISGNKAEENGGGVYTYDTVSYMNDGSITDNEAIKDGGGVCVDFEVFNLNGGTIARNVAGVFGGGIVTSGYNLHLRAFTDLNITGGIIEENHATSGGAIFLTHTSPLTAQNCIIRNNIAEFSGGAIAFRDQGGGSRKPNPTDATLINVTLTGNVAETVNGGAIHWNQETWLDLRGCTITGNSAPNGLGGGIYVVYGNVAYSGSMNITGNTAFTDRSDNASNVYFTNEASANLLQNYKSAGNMNADSKIGLSFKDVYITYKYLLNYTDSGANFDEEITKCFFSDDPYYVVDREQREDGYYNMFLSENTDCDIDPVFTITTSDGTKEYNGHRDGWRYALAQSATKSVTITLHSDWKTRDGSFSYSVGTYEGALYLSEDCTRNITIDLNGYTIDRGLTSEKKDGSVFYMDTPGSLTIMDSSENKTGKITGGNTYSSSPILFGKGGGIYIDNGTLYFKGGTITGNTADYGGGIYCDNGSEVYIQGGKISGNAARIDGGGIYINDGNLYFSDGAVVSNNAVNGGGIFMNDGDFDFENGNIRYNRATLGGGVYWNSYDQACLTGGKITGNYGEKAAGGVYVSLYGSVYLGGDIQITDNHFENLFLPDHFTNISNAKGQPGVPNKPLTEGAKIGVTSGSIEEDISASDSKFGELDYRYFFSDDVRYFIRTVYDPDGGDNAYKLFINSWTHEDARHPMIKSTTVKNSDLLIGAAGSIVVTNADNVQTIYLTARNTKRNFFESVALSELIECTLDSDTTYIADMDVMLDLRYGREYKLVSDNGTYVMFKVEVNPDGGKWAEEQEIVTEPYRMTVSYGIVNMGFKDFGEGWAEAISLERPVTITLFRDWIAPNGSFDYSEGADDGRLYLDEDYMDITIDLNGHTISRDLKSATDNGQVFLIEGGAKLTITDNSAKGGGKITGAYNDGDGGAFYIDYGELHINGGEISGNKANNGGAIYSTNEDDSFVYINGGKITKNVATEEGGAIFMEEGFLYVDGGEISKNYATNGGGIYWNSENKLCLTGGVIKDNTAVEGAGVYATDWGDMYIGGTIMVINNYKNTTIKSNFYISDTDAYLNNAAGQTDVPNKPLTDGASVYISAASEDFCISDSNSRFTENSANYLYTDYSSHIIRTVYNANGGNHSYKLYYNNRLTSNVTIPGVKSVEGVNSCINSLHFNHDDQYIDLRFDIEHRDDGTLKNVALSDLVSVTFDHDGTTLVDFDTKRDFTKDQEFMILASDGTYALLTVYVEWDCTHPSDEEHNGVCDVCGEYIRTAFAINRYDKDLLCTVLIIPEAGTYTVMFVDYEDGTLKNIDFVECTLSAGFNAVYQEIRGFKLEDGDKVMLMSGFTPVCKELVIE